MNKVLFDGSATQSTEESPYHGGGEYAKFILCEAIKSGYSFDVVFKKSFITDPYIIQLLDGEDQCRLYYVLSNEDIYKLIEENKYAKFYSALPYKFLNYPCAKTLFIQVIHGLRSIELPWDTYRYKYYNTNLERFFTKIISSSNILQQILKEKHIKETSKLLSIPNSIFFTVSEHSKYALLNFYPFLKPEDIKVFYSTAEISNHPLHKKINEKYYLMVNANRYEKNIYRAIQAFDKLITDGRIKNAKIVITGCNTYPFFKKIKNINYFTLLPYVSKKEIEYLYSNAFAFVYPSLNEGFGCPPLKAMGYNVPVIASACTSISEVCDNGALYFNPLSIDEICNRILQIDCNEELRKNLVKNGSIRVQNLLRKQDSELKIILKLIFEDEVV
jgi:glycosyltransferase involved in cell wall biosynthesis